MTQLISAGGASFISKPFYTTSPIVITALGLGAGKATLQLITVVDTTQPNNGTPCNPKADVSNLDVTSRTDYPCFKLCAASPVGSVPIGGWYVVSLTPDTTLATASVTYEQVSIEQANAVPKCNGCEDVVAPVTAAVTGLPCPLPALFVWNGVTTTLSAFIADVKAQVSDAAYNAGTCSFTAPEGSVFPSLAVSAVVVVPPPAPVTQAITPCPATFPLVWDYDGATYATLGAFVNAYKAAMLPVAVTFVAPCTFSAPAGTVFLPTALSAVPVVPPAPSFALGGAGTPLPCPVVYPVTYNGNAYNSLAALKAAIETDQSVTLAYNAATCAFTQTGGVGTFTNPNVAPATVVAVTPCPPVFPMVWTVDGTTYPSLSAFKAAFDSYYSVTSQYSTTPTCQLTILTGDVSPLPVASLTATNKLVLSPCPTFPAQWHGQVYATVTAFATGVAAQGTGWSYDIATCTINAPQGVTIPSAPTAAPTAPITGVACPIVYPVVYPATTGATYANQAALDAAVEAQLGVSVTVSSTTPCQVVQTSGAVGLLPASIVVSAPVVVPPCHLTLGAQHTNNAGGRIYTLVDCPPSKRASYVSAGWVQLSDNAGNYETLLSPTAQVVCGIDFTEPYLNNAGAVIGYTPY